MPCVSPLPVLPVSCCTACPLLNNLYCCPQVVPGLPFFATRVQLGPEGVAKINGLGPLNDYEKAALDSMVPELKAQIEKGLAFAKAN